MLEKTSVTSYMHLNIKHLVINTQSLNSSFSLSTHIDFDPILTHGSKITGLAKYHVFK